LVAESDVVGEGCLGVLHGRIVGTNAGSKRASPGEFRELCRFEDIARSAFDALEINTVEEHDQIGRLDGDAGRVGITGGWEPEGSAFQPLINDQESVGIPKEQLDPIPASIPENEEMTGEGIFAEDTLHQVRETVESFA